MLSPIKETFQKDPPTKKSTTYTGKGTMSANPIRYNLSLPEKVMSKVKQLAEEDCTTTLIAIRKLIKIGILVSEAQRKGARTVLEFDNEKIVLTDI